MRRPPHRRDPPDARDAGTGGEDEPPDLPAGAPGDEVVELPTTDVLDLHSFLPREVSAVVRDYLDAAYDLGLRELRIIHGRGIGVQREMVRALLGRDPRVVAFGDAPAEAGGWGATWVRLR
jgi:DNA-nicking Smr family endonuclease